MKRDIYSFHFVGLIFGESHEAIAGALEMYAARIRRGDLPPGGSPDRMILRQGDRGGCAEEAFVCRMYGVYHDADYEPRPIAMFSDQEMAQRFAQGRPLYESEGDRTNVDMCVMRTDVALSAWNSVDPDPHEEELL